MSSRLMEVRERYKQLRRKASYDVSVKSPDVIKPSWKESKAEVSVEELENPLPRCSRYSSAHDESFEDSVSTANILNPPVQAFGKGLGTVAASIEVLGHRDLLRASADSNGEEYGDIIYEHMRRTKQTLPLPTASPSTSSKADFSDCSILSSTLSCTQPLKTSEVLQPPLWFREYGGKHENRATCLDVEGSIEKREARPSGDVINASLETIKLFVDPDKGEATELQEEEDSLDHGPGDDLAAGESIEEGGVSALLEDVPCASPSPSGSSTSQHLVAEINLIDLTIQEEDEAEILSQKRSSDTLLLSSNHTLGSSQLSETASLCNRTYVGVGTLAAEIGGSARLGSCDNTSPAGPPQRTDSGPELAAVSEMTPVEPANGPESSARPSGREMTTLPTQRQTVVAEKRVQVRPQLQDNGVQVEESDLSSCTESKSGEPEPSILPEHLKDRLLNQLYKRCCHSPLRLARLLKEFGGDENMMAKDEEMLRQSIGVESDVGRRQFHNIVAAMVRRSCDGVCVGHTGGTGASLQVCFDELMARSRVTGALDDASWASLMRDALGKVESVDLGQLILDASRAMMEQMRPCNAVTVGVQTQSFRLAVEHSAPYSELLNKYETKCKRVATLERQLTRAATVMAASREGTFKEKQLARQLEAMQEDRDRATEALAVKEKQMAKIEEELEAVKEQYASMECEVSRLQQAQTAAFKLKTVGSTGSSQKCGRAETSRSQSLGAVVGSPCVASATQRKSNDFVCRLLKAEGWSMGKLPSRGGLLSRQPIPHRRVFRILSSPCGSWRLVWDDPAAPEKTKRHRMVQLADIVRVEFGETSQCYRRMAATGKSWPGSRQVDKGVKPHSGEGSGWCISLVLREGASRAALDLVLPNRNAFEVWVLGINELCDYSSRLKSLTRETFMLYKALNDDAAVEPMASPKWERIALVRH